MSSSDDPLPARGDQGAGARRRRFARRRILLWLLVLLLAAGVAFFGGGGWYFAGQIRSDGLLVRRSSPDYDLSVVSSQRGEVTLRELADRPAEPDLRTSDVYGLEWPGGSGVLGTVISTATSNSGSVARALSVTEGIPPTPGQRAALRIAVYDDPQSAYGVAFSDVGYDCAGGRCPAWYVPGRSQTWAIMVHGKGASRTEPLRALGGVLRAGLPALIITYRNDVGAPVDPSHYYRYGASEWADLQDAVGYAVRHGARRVVLVGVSMGGAIVASFMQHSASAGLVSGLLLDAPMLDFRRTVDYGASQRTLPVIGSPIPAPLTWTAEEIAGHRFGVDWKRVDYLPGGWLHVPALLFHGTADDTVPIATSDAFARQYPRLVREIRVEGAAHVGSWNVDPQRYTAASAEFLRAIGAAS
jgi:pimeloyl-ACP methyl ester carboxylesterase